MNNHFNKRGRNNHQRRRQGVNPNRALDSNGPDVRIRGTAQQIYDKYQALARDAQSSGDRVKAENYLQHAEHYFRVLRAAQGPQAQPFDQSGGDSDLDSDQPSIGEQRDFREQRQPAPQFSDAEEPEAPRAEIQQAAVVAADENEPREPEQRTQEARQQGGGDHEGRRRRRRPRRPREDGSPEQEAAEDVEPVSIS